MWILIYLQLVCYFGAFILVTHNNKSKDFYRDLRVIKLRILKTEKGT